MDAERLMMRWLCKVGLHEWPLYVNAHTQAPAPIRCYRCGRSRGASTMVTLPQASTPGRRYWLLIGGTFEQRGHEYSGPYSSYLDAAIARPTIERISTLALYIDEAPGGSR